MMPLYGFLEGDTIGILLLCREDERVDALRTKLEQSARLRASPPRDPVVMHEGRVLDPMATLAQAGIRALDRVDVVGRRS